MVNGFDSKESTDIMVIQIMGSERSIKVRKLYPMQKSLL